MSDREECGDCGQTEREGHRADCPQHESRQPSPPRTADSLRILMQYAMRGRRTPDEVREIIAAYAAIEAEAAATSPSGECPECGAEWIMCDHLADAYRYLQARALLTSGEPEGPAAPPANRHGGAIRVPVVVEWTSDEAYLRGWTEARALVDLNQMASVLAHYDITDTDWERLQTVLRGPVSEASDE